MTGTLADVCKAAWAMHNEQILEKASAILRDWKDADMDHGHRLSAAEVVTLLRRAIDDPFAVGLNMDGYRGKP